MISPRPSIILGPPGTGKTHTLLGLVEDALSRGVPPDRLGFVTFTRRAAEEAVTRACERFNLERKQLPYFRTLHSMCYRMLGLSRNDVLSGDRLRRDFASFAGVRVRGDWTDEGASWGQEEGDRLLFMENLARVRGIPLREQYEADHDGLPWRRVEHVALALARFKLEYGLMDYTDMLSAFLSEGQAPPLEELFVDEAQDQSALQWRVVNKLAQGARRLWVAGDDDQAIYRWAGADVEHLIAMEGDVCVLGQSYRCPTAVQEVGESLLSGLSSRRPKEWMARAEGGDVQRQRGIDGLELVDQWGSDGVQPVLVLVRNDYLIGDVVAPYLRSQGIYYERHGHPSVSSALLRAITDWERLRRGHAVPVADVRRIYARMASGAAVARGHKELPGVPDEAELTLGDLQRDHGLLVTSVWHESMKLPDGDREYIRAIRARGQSLVGRPPVRISTVHASKGGQANHVVLLLQMATRTYNESRLFPDDERRVWYVAVTRARERLTLVGSRRTARDCAWL